MTAGFDWSGAPEGERWESHEWGRYVITGKVVRWWSRGRLEWLITSADPDWVRSIATRVEPARPVARVGDRVRVTIEGVVIDVYEGETCWDIRPDGYPDARRFFWPKKDGAQVEVLERADPPLNPGDLVRDRDGNAWAVLETNSEGMVFRHIAGRLSNHYYDELPGPLVKVELREVPGG